MMVFIAYIQHVVQYYQTSKICQQYLHIIIYFLLMDSLTWIVFCKLYQDIHEMPFSVYVNSYYITCGRFLRKPPCGILAYGPQTIRIQAECFNKPASQGETPHVHSLGTVLKRHVMSTRMIKWSYSSSQSETTSTLIASWPAKVGGYSKDPTV